ncbi:MAG TPA: two-component regulator propeller domain-containing protein [Dongiaceae bacterium]|nr:two-component regulator propeller domain-containing protein [Dongiaceae bacterium]
MIPRLHILLLLVTGWAGLVTAAALPPGSTPDYLVTSWQTDNGLPENWVSSITQTPDGYLWVGTRYGGMARFDGVRFVPFTPQNTPELKDVQVEHLFADGTGRLWIVMGNESVTCMEAGRFRLQREPRAEPRLRVDNILKTEANQVWFSGEGSYLPRLNLAAGTNGWEVLTPHPGAMIQAGTCCQDATGTIWYITQGHLPGRFWDGQFEAVPPAAGLPEAQITDLVADGHRQIWVATRHHLAVWNGHRFEDRTPDNGPEPLNILRIAASGDGGIWVLERYRLRKYLGGRWVTETNPEQFQPNLSGNSFSLYGDAQGNAWMICYGHGLWHVKSNGVARQLTEQDGLPSVFITCWFQDREDDVWVGTTGGGLARIRESMFHVLGRDEGLGGKVVRSVCVSPDGELWAGTAAGGLARWEESRFTDVPLPPLNAEPVESVTVTPAADGGVWIGSLNHGLMRWQSNTVTRPVATTGLGASVRVLFTDRRGRLWVGGLVNLFRYEAGRFQQLGAREGFVDNHAIGGIAEDAAGTIWIGTGPGDLWKCENDHFTRYTPPAEWPSVRFAAVLPDTNGVVWVGTLGNGLLRFENGRFTRFTTADGLPDNNITQLLDGQEGNLWAGTYAGIFRVSKADLRAAASRGGPLPCRVYGRFDGLPALECSSGFQPACWQAANGSLWFTTANGLVTVEPHAVTSNRQPPVVIIEEMLVDGKKRSLPAPVISTRLQTPPPVTIEPGRHYVQFQFTGLNFAAPDGVRFRVKLDGVDKDWQDPGTLRLIGYGPLLPGHYQMRVRACNNDGIWNDTDALLPFEVLPSFWQTWWFKAGLAGSTLLVLGLGVGWAQRRRYRSKLERVERQRAVERERARIAQDLHDDLGTSLTQISMLSALANRTQTPPAEARELIQQVRGRARDMVTALDEIVWAVNPKNDSWLELTNYLGHFAEEFFRPTGIRCRLDIPEQLPESPVSAELRHHLFLAYKEAVNNAARHSQATHVQIRVETRATEVVIFVEDNGVGFTRPVDPEPRPRNGLANMKHRLEQLGGTAEIQSVPGQGTTVAFHVPLS